MVGGTPEAKAVEGPRASAGQALLHHPLFTDAGRTTFRHAQELDRDGMLGRTFSASYAPRAPEQVERFAADLGAVFERFQHDGKVVLCYETSVYTGRRRDLDRI